MLDFEELRRSSAAAEDREEELENNGRFRVALDSVSPQQRLILAVMLFLNIVILGFLCLVATNTISLPI